MAAVGKIILLILEWVCFLVALLWLGLVVFAFYESTDAEDQPAMSGWRCFFTVWWGFRRWLSRSSS
jgi:hypothetical protein